MMPLQKIVTPTNRNIATAINVLVDRVNILGKVTGQNGITVLQSEAGTSLVGTGHKFGGFSDIRVAYCKNDAGAATTITCYESYDSTGSEIEVNFSIAGGGNCNEAIPRLSDGDKVFIGKVHVLNEWWCLTTLQATVDCICSE